MVVGGGGGACLFMCDCVPGLGELHSCSSWPTV